MQRYSVNTVDRTIKVKPTDVYVALGTTDFDTLMEEVTEYVHNFESEQDYYEDYEQSVNHFQPVVRVRQPVADSKLQASTCVVKVEEEVDFTGWLISTNNLTGLSMHHGRARHTVHVK